MHLLVKIVLFVAASLWTQGLYPMNLQKIDLQPKLPCINKPDGLSEERAPYFWHYNGGLAYSATRHQKTWMVDAEKTFSHFPVLLRTKLADKNIPVSNIYFIITIHFFSKNDTNTLSINTSFHDYVRFIYKKKTGNWSAGFNIEIPIGLFCGNGVTQQDIVFDSFSDLQVYYHDGHYSPDNARFSIKGDRNIATFWMVGIEPGSKQALVSYNLFMNSTEHFINDEKYGYTLDNLLPEDENKKLENLLEYANNTASKNPDLNGFNKNQSRLKVDENILKHINTNKTEITRLTTELSNTNDDQKKITLSSQINDLHNSNFYWLFSPKKTQTTEEKKTIFEKKEAELQAAIAIEKAFTPANITLTKQEDQEALRNFVTTMQAMQKLSPIAEAIIALKKLLTKLGDLSSQLDLLKNQLQKLKKHINTMIPPRLNAIKTSSSFYDKFGDSEWSFDTTKPFITQWGNVTFGYYEDGYPKIERRAIITMLPTMLNHAPENLKQALCNINNLAIYTVISGPTRPTTACNTLFHEFLLKDLSIRNNYQKNLAMGLFEGNGVSKADLSFDSLTELDVNYHDHGSPSGACYSPNNARFNITAGRNISTFWIAGINPGKTKAIVLYNLFTNTLEQTEIISHLFAAATSFDDLLSNLHAHAQTLISDADKEALEGFITTMQAMRTP